MNEANVRQALQQAHAYVSHDWFCDPTGFAFVVNNGARQVGMMGDEVKFNSGMKLKVFAPASGMIRLFRNGTMVQEGKGDSMDFAVAEPGTYRAEVWLELDGEWRLWINANQIRIIQTRQPESGFQLGAPVSSRASPLITRLPARAELELGLLKRLGLASRVGGRPALEQQIAAYQRTRNGKEVKIAWQFTTADARVKLKRLCPFIEP